MSLEYINYWRNDLIESDLTYPRPKDSSYEIEANHEQIIAGLITDADVLQKITDAKKRINKYSTSDSVDVQIGLFQGSAKGAENQDQYKTIYPLWLTGSLNHKTGELSPSSERLPYIPRVFLDPQDSAQYPLVGSIDLMLEYWQHHDHTLFGTWKEYVDYSDKMLAYASKGYKLGNRYNRLNKPIIILDESVFKPARHIINNLNYIIRQGHTPPLLQELCSGITESNPVQTRTPHELLVGSLRHMGQMSSKFPLAPSQREALQYFMTMNDREILAVNGPPGTGKTSLIHSVIASLWVEAAYLQSEPPLIVITSSNNKAVSNAIDSFNRAFEAGDLLGERWLPPPVENFGLYMISTSALSDKIQEQYHCHTSEKFYGEPIESWEYITEAEKYYLERFRTTFGFGPSSLQEALKFVRDEIYNVVSKIQAPVKGRKDTFDAMAQLVQATGLGEHELINDTRKKINQQLESSRQTLDDIRDANQEIQALRDKKNHEVKLLTAACNQIQATLKPGLIGTVKNLFMAAQKFNLKVYLSDNGLSKYINEIEGLSLPSALDYLETAARTLSLSVEKLDESIAGQLKQTLILKSNISTMDGYCDQYLKAVSAWENNYPDLANTYDWEAKLDPDRHQAFLLAQHYWEGRWLLTVKDYLVSIQDIEPKKHSAAETIARYKRYSMLTPGLVCTLYMIPRFFNYSQDRVTIPLFNHIDLLIVDEAGQTLPSISSAAFGLARKALVLGDVAQIPPVVQTAARIDHANLVKCGMVKTTGDPIRDDGLFEQEHNKYYTVTHGNTMRLAQKACRYLSLYSPNDGVFLREHFRSFDEIVNISNELAYGGQLRPLRGNSPGTFAPVLGYVNINNGKAVRRGDSWINTEEAALAAGWIYKFRKELLSHYKGKSLDEIIAVITPFKPQAKIIRERLDKYGLKSVEAGTVHTFQGGEKDIIIFSSVYDDPGAGLFMLNDTVNLINVAISRARDSFLFFGKTEILTNPGRGTQVLQKHIIGKGQNIPLKTKASAKTS